MTTLLTIAGAWLLLAIPAAVVIGRSIHTTGDAEDTHPLYVPADWTVAS